MLKYLDIKLFTFSTTISTSYLHALLLIFSEMETLSTF